MRPQLLLLFPILLLLALTQCATTSPTSGPADQAPVIDTVKVCPIEAKSDVPDLSPPPAGISTDTLLDILVSGLGPDKAGALWKWITVDLKSHDAEVTRRLKVVHKACAD